MKKNLKEMDYLDLIKRRQRILNKVSLSVSIISLLASLAVVILKFA